MTIYEYLLIVEDMTLDAITALLFVFGICVVLTTAIALVNHLRGGQ